MALITENTARDWYNGHRIMAVTTVMTTTPQITTALSSIEKKVIEYPSENITKKQ
jgi:hypothetical protein